MKKTCVAITFLVSAIVCPGQETPSKFYDVIRSGDTAGLRKLIAASGAGVKDNRNTTPLMYAAAVGSVETMKALIDAGADVNARNDFDITALMWCATDEAKVRLLVSKGADVNAKSKQGRTPLLIASATQGNLAVVKLLLEKGADVAKADADPATTPLSAAAGADDPAIFHLLLDHGAGVAGPSGAFSLITAAGLGNLDMVQTLLSKGVPVNVKSPPPLEKVKNGDVQVGFLTPLILAVANGGPEMVKVLLDKKADINAQDVRGMTPLMLAIATDHPDPRVVRILLDHGADRALKSKTGETAMDWAIKFNNPEVLKVLGGSAAPVQPVVLAKNADAADALRKSAGILQNTADKFFLEGGCASCHSHNLISMALDASRSVGVPLEASLTESRARQTKTMWASQEQTLMLRMDAPGGHDMASYAVFQFAAERAKPNSTTDALVHNIAAQQSTAGNWHDYGIMRPPLTDGDFTPTAIAIRSLALYGAPGRKAEFDAKIARAVAWLRAAKPVTQEDADMQLLGLKWAGQSSNALEPFARKIAAAQRTDGGWGQTVNLPSDSYATGQALVALKESGMSASDPVYKKGAAFLLGTQLADGTWHVASRAPKIQPYFQSGFPHGHDQWISMTGTAWATTALSYTLTPVKALPVVAGK